MGVFNNKIMINSLLILFEKYKKYDYINNLYSRNRDISTL